MEGLEFQRIAAGIAEKESRLFAGLAFKAYARLDDEGNFLFGKARRKFAPLRHGKNCTEMTHRNIIAIHQIMVLVSGLIRA